MDTSDETKAKVVTYNLNCSSCKTKTEFKVILISKKYGAKLECLKCGKTMRKNMKYLQTKKNGN